MTLPIEFHTESRLDFDQSFDWYAERSAAAAVGFITAFEETLRSISLEPLRFPETAGGCRSCALKKYPFRVVYLPTTEKIIVIAVEHAKRRPGYWRKRLS